MTEKTASKRLTVDFRDPAKELREPTHDTKSNKAALLLMREQGVTKREIMEACELRDLAAASAYLSYDIPRSTGLGWESHSIRGERRYFAILPT